ncbi:DEAD DEAH box helicase [Coemansia sp. BCRC 34490]|nr:DEAD DEAH box helicase [Coemansia sp. BCRC 34490]
MFPKGTQIIHARFAHTLRPYQKECIDTCIALFKKGVRRQAVSLPVGSGKTVIFSNLINNVPAPTPLATKTIVLAHREELLAQAAKQIEDAMPNLVVEIDQGTRVANPAADVIVASVPTLGREQSDRLSRYDPRRFKLLVIDEAHHAAAETYTRIVKHFEATPDLAAEPGHRLFVWGCSATLHRHDGLGLGGVFDKIVYRKQFVDMIREGHLSRMKVVTVCTGTRINKVRVYAGDFAVKALSSVVNNQTRNLSIVKAYQTFAQGKRKSTLVFAVDIAHARTLCQIFNHYGVAAKTVLSTTSTADRESTLREFRDRSLPVIINCGILTEGTDIPNIDCVMMARPTRSLVLFQQMIGRGMRLFTGKSDCLVVDLIDSFDGSKSSHITVPTLLGLDPQLVFKETDILDGRAVSQLAVEHRLANIGRSDIDEDEDGTPQTGGILQELDAELLSKLPRTLGSLESMGFTAKTHLNPLNFFELPRLFDHHTAASRAGELEMVSAGNHHLRQLSRYAWVCLTPTYYMLSGFNMTFAIRKNKPGDLWQGYVKRTLRSKRKEGSLSDKKKAKGDFVFSVVKKPVMEAEEFEHALHGMDTLVKIHCGSQAQLKLFMWDAPWRKLPPTPMQISMLKRFVAELELPKDSVPDTAAASSSGPPATGSATVVRVLSGGSKGKAMQNNGGVQWLNRGIATNLIVRMRNGSIGWWKDATKAQERLDSAQRERDADLKQLAAWGDIMGDPAAGDKKAAM